MLRIFQGLVILYISALGIENHMDYLFFILFFVLSCVQWSLNHFIWSNTEKVMTSFVPGRLGACIVLKGTGSWTVVSGSEQMRLLGLYCTFTFMYDLSGMRRHWM